MTRIIKTGQTPAKRRHAHMRSCAEVLRLLAQRNGFDEEAKDMLAFLVFNLRDIYKTIDESARAWDDRNYWKKAEGLREKWRWSRVAGDKLEKLIRNKDWHEIPVFLLTLIPHFQSITITAVTRDSDWWCGAYRALMRKNKT